MSLLFTGDFANPKQPLWLSALGPNVPPSNLQVSTLTVNSSGGVVMKSGGQAYPSTTGAPVAFNRADNASLSATQLQQTPSHNVPTKSVETTYLAATTSGGFIYDDIAMAGLQIYGAVPTDPGANSGCAGYLTRGSLPFTTELHTGSFKTSVINSGTINTSNLNATNANISTLRLSTITLPDITVSSVTAQTGNINTINNSLQFNGNQLYASTLFAKDNITVGSSGIGSYIRSPSTVTNFLSTGLIKAAEADVTTISTNSIAAFNMSTNYLSADVGNFSTISSSAASVKVSSIDTVVLSTTVGVVKELFVSTMQFNATLSPNIDLGLGGIVGGIIGGATANTLSLGLGAANLATGIGSLVSSRQSGGVNPSVYQTVNGTAQLQFSTLGTNTTTTFVLTDSVDPRHAPGNPTSNVTTIPAGSYCVRTVSDPLNLANSSGAAGQGIQGFSEWEPVYPGSAQVTGSRVSSIVTGNFMDLGGPSDNNVSISTVNGNINLFPLVPAGVGYVNINGALTANAGITTGSAISGAIVNATVTSAAPRYNTSTILARGFDGASTPSTIGIYPGIVTSTINVSTLTIGNVVEQGLSANNLTTLSSMSTLGYTRLAVDGVRGVQIGNNPPVSLGGNDLVVTGQVYAGGTVTATTSGSGTSYIDGTKLSINNGNSQFISNGGGGLIMSTVLGGTPNPFLEVVGGVFTKYLNTRGDSAINTGWLPVPQPVTYPSEFRIFLGGWQILFGNTGGSTFAGGYNTFTFQYPFKTGFLPFLIVNGNGQTNTFANGNAISNTQFRASAANSDGTGTTNSINYIAIGVSPYA